MNYLVYEVDASAGDVVQVILDSQANVKVMGFSDYNSYRGGRSHRYYGGLAEVSPVNIPVPHTGHWYVTVDLGGYAGHVRASVRVI